MSLKSLQAFKTSSFGNEQPISRRAMLQHVSMRRRTGGIFATFLEKEMHLLGEFSVEGVNLLIAIAQFCACWGFYPEYSHFYKTACIMFLVTSVISVFVLGHAIHEAHEHHSLNDKEEGKHQREVAELILFLLASLLFAVGSILFLPEMTKYHEVADIHAGTWCFLLGSAQLALAFFVNSLSVAAHGTWGHQTLRNKLAIISLFLGQAGSILFLIGTPAYFPELASGCSSRGWNITRFGTDMYVAGAVSYMLGALLNLYLAYVKHCELEHKRELRRLHPRLHHGRTTGFGATGSAATALLVEDSNA